MRFPPCVSTCVIRCVRVCLDAERVSGCRVALCLCDMFPQVGRDRLCLLQILLRQFPASDKIIPGLSLLCESRSCTNDKAVKPGWIHAAVSDVMQTHKSPPRLLPSAPGGIFLCNASSLPHRWLTRVTSSHRLEGNFTSEKQEIGAHSAL